MSKIKAYISGKISGLPLSVAQKRFADMARMIEHAGYVPVNPLCNGLPASATWEDHMKVDIKLMIDCDVVYLLPGWEDSKGARIEKELADVLGIPCIRYFDEWEIKANE